MVLNRWNMFKQLFQKEWDLVKYETYFVLALALTINLTVVVLNIERAAPFYVFVFMAPFLVPLYLAIRLFSREWSDGSIYLLLSLPVKGYFVLLTKLLAILAGLVIQAIGAYGLTLVFYASQIAKENVPELNQMLALLFSEHASKIFQIGLAASLSVIAGIALVSSAIFLSQSLSRLVSKYRALGGFISFLFLLWFYSRALLAIDRYLLPILYRQPVPPPQTTFPLFAVPWLQISHLLLATTFMVALYIAAAAYIFDTRLEL